MVALDSGNPVNDGRLVGFLSMLTVHVSLFGAGGTVLNEHIFAWQLGQ